MAFYFTLTNSTLPQLYITTDLDDQLERMNEIKYVINLPCIVSYLLALVFGTLGNTVVIFVCVRKLPRSSANTLIKWMASFDLVNCLLLSYEIYDKRYSMYSGRIVVVCKIVRFLETFLTVGSCMILLGLALERYLKICKPVKSLRFKTERYILPFAIIFGLCTSWPNIIFYGSEKVKMTGFSAAGNDCTYVQSLVKSPYRGVYSLLMFVFACASFSVLMFLYALVFKSVRQWKNRVDVATSPDAVISNIERRSIENSGEGRRISILKETTRFSFNSKAPRTMEVKSVTFSFFLLGFAFIVSFIPVCVVEVLNSLGVIHVIEMDTLEEKQAAVLANSSYLLNSAVNPLIYGFFNPQFRREILSLVHKWKCRVCDKTKDTKQQLGNVYSNDKTNDINLQPVTDVISTEIKE